MKATVCDIVPERTPLNQSYHKKSKNKKTGRYEYLYSYCTFFFLTA